MFQNIVDFPTEVDSKNWTKNDQKKWYDNCAVLRLLRQIEYVPEIILDESKALSEMRNKKL